MSTPLRISGSPPRPIKRVNADDRPVSLFVVTSLPVIIRPQVAALTNSDGACAHMRAPVALADLVADQRVARRAIGNAQQRFGEAHQRDAFLAGQRELVDQPFDAAARLLLAQRFDELRRQRLRFGWRRSPAGAPARRETARTPARDAGTRR